MYEKDIDIPIEFEVLAHEALMNIWWTGTLLKRAARRFFKSTPFSEAEFNLLIVLRHSPQQLSQNDLSERLLVDKSNVTNLIDRLQKAGMIERHTDPNDRRRYHVTLTDEGQRQIDAVDPTYHDMVQRIMHNLSDRDYRSLIRLTRDVRRGIAELETDKE